MSQVLLSRGELYEQYKNKNSLARNGAEYPVLGVAFLVASIITAIILLIITYTASGYATADPSALQFIFTLTGGICGPGAGAGLILLAIWYCKRRNMLAEKLTEAEIASIVGRIN